MTATLPSRTYPFLLGGELRGGADSVEIRLMVDSGVKYLSTDVYRR